MHKTGRLKRPVILYYDLDEFFLFLTISTAQKVPITIMPAATLNIIK